VCLVFLQLLKVLPNHYTHQKLKELSNNMARVGAVLVLLLGALLGE
jgi:hypothetical protein